MVRATHLSLPAVRRTLPRRLSVSLVWLLGAVIGLGVLALTVLPRTGLYHTYVVLSASMEPAIPRGSIAIVAPVPPSSLRVGDVITYVSAIPPNPTFTHRIVEIGAGANGPTFKTKGDANQSIDPWTLSFPKEVGKVVVILPYMGRLLFAAGSPGFQLGLAALLGLALAWRYLAAIWAPRRPEPVEIGPAPARQGPVSAVRAVILGSLILGLAYRVVSSRANS